VIIQGRSGSDQYITEFEVLYSLDISGSFTAVPARFYSNAVGNAKNEFFFPGPVSARYIKIVVWGWVRHISGRFGLLVCNDVLQGQKNVFKSNPPYSARTHSSVHIHNGSPLDKSMLDSGSMWHAAAGSGAGSWMMMDLQSATDVLGVIIQGRGDLTSQYITEFEVLYSLDISGSFTAVPARFYSNAVGNAKNEFFFPGPVSARYIKIVVWGWVSVIVGRFGLLVGNVVLQDPTTVSFYHSYVDLECSASGKYVYLVQPNARCMRVSEVEVVGRRHACTACAAGKYEDNTGSTSCKQCPWGWETTADWRSSSHPHSKSADSCKCNRGLSGVGGGFFQDVEVHMPGHIGTTGNISVVFDASKAQFLHAGLLTAGSVDDIYQRPADVNLHSPRALKLQSNGGLTAVLKIKFSGAAPDWETVFDFGNSNHSILDNVFMQRKSSSLWVGIANGASAACTLEAEVAPDEWATWVFSFDASTNSASLSKDLVSVVGPTSCVATPLDRNFTRMFVGRSTFATTAAPSERSYLNGEIKELFVSDEKLISLMSTCYSRGTGQAHTCPVLQSSTNSQGSIGAAAKASDGDAATCSLTWTESSPWWRLDLEASRHIVGIAIMGDLDGAQVRLGNLPSWDKNPICADQVQASSSSMARVPCPGHGRFIFVVLPGSSRSLSLCQIDVMGLYDNSSSAIISGLIPRCTACVPGTYKDVVGSEGCKWCPAGTFSTTAVSKRMADCRMCDFGKYFDSQGATSCFSCGNSTTTSSWGRSNMQPRRSDHFSCTCKEGYSGLPHGSYTWRVRGDPPFHASLSTPSQTTPFRLETLCPKDVDNARLSRCGIGDSIEVTVSNPDSGAMVATAVTIVSLPVFADVSVTGSGFLVAMSHVAGDQTTLTLPDPAVFRSFEFFEVKTSDPVFASSTYASMGLYECAACLPGSYKATESTQACILCAKNKYNSEPAAIECSECPPKTTSNEGSSNATDCLCPPGYFGRAPCDACEPGTFKAFNGSAPCLICSPGKFSSLAAANSSDYCQDCEANTYPIDNRSRCVNCPANSVALAGSSLVLDCKCNVGYTGPDGEPCRACASGTYKVVNGSQPCEQCGGGKYSSPTTSLTSCAACEANTFSSANNSRCVPCPPHSISASGSASVSTECRCVSC